MSKKMKPRDYWEIAGIMALMFIAALVTPYLVKLVV